MNIYNWGPKTCRIYNQGCLFVTIEKWKEFPPQIKQNKNIWGSNTWMVPA